MKYFLMLLPLLVACSGGGGDKSSGSQLERFQIEVTQETKTNVLVFSDEFILSDSLPPSHSEDCGLNPEGGKRYSYEINGDRLSIDDGRVNVTYVREGEFRGLHGKWSMETSTDGNMKSGTIEFIDGRTVHIISLCKQ